MKRRIVAIAAAALLGALAVGASAQPPASPSAAWLHVRVEEPAKPTKVSVNLPLSVVQIALEAAPEKIAHHGEIDLHTGHDHLSVADMRKMWRELRAAGDTDLVQVEEKDHTVSVARRGDRVEIRVTGDENVKVDVPVTIVDALLAGDGPELDVRGAMKQIEKLRGDVVHVQGKDATVRVWIDERN